MSDTTRIRLIFALLAIMVGIVACVAFAAIASAYTVCEDADPCGVEPGALPRLYMPAVMVQAPAMAVEYNPVVPVATVTPEVQPQQHLAIVAFGVPTATPAPSAGPCPCYADLYNCADFASQYEAQQCYNWCMVQGLGDPHKIDRDADGVACESNN